MTKVVAACMVNNLGQLLPYTCQSSVQKCLEWCEENVLAWDKHLEHGAIIAQVEIEVVRQYSNEQLNPFRKSK